MNFEPERRGDGEKLGEMYENLSNITKQLTLLQGFLESKFGSEYANFCQLSEQAEASSSEQAYTVDGTSMQEDGGDYDKMPNLVSQESPSRTLGYVSVPLRQPSIAGLGPGPNRKLQMTHSLTITGSGEGTKREKNNVVKDDMDIESHAGQEDMMYPLHNFSDLLVEDAGDEDTNETPEFLELELDPTTLLRGEPPSLQPMFSESNGQADFHSISNNNTGHPHKRSGSRQSGSSFHKYEVDFNNSMSVRGNVSRRASVGGHENNHSLKKFDCLICGIKFEFAETLKSHMDSHAGSRSSRSNSEDQSGVGNSPNAPPLPKLKPRPSMTSISLPGDITVEVSDPSSLKATRKKKSQILSQSSSKGSMRRRKRCNQSRPCSLVCPECGLKIRDRSRLIEHLRGHTGERPFQCSFCDKSYTRKDVLKTHMVKMHGEGEGDGDPSQLASVSDIKYDEVKYEDEK